MINVKISLVYVILNMNKVKILSPSQIFEKLLGQLLSEGELILQEHADVGSYGRF